MADSKIRLLCLRCRATLELPRDHDLTACPECGSHGVPADLDDTAAVTLTTHELRILTMWASNWAQSIADKPRCEDSPQVIQGILDHLGQQTAAPLSLAQELADLRAAFPESDVTVHRDGKTTNE